MGSIGEQDAGRVARVPAQQVAVVVPVPRRDLARGPEREELAEAHGSGFELRTLGFFAAVPIAYLTLVVVIQVLKPLLV